MDEVKAADLENRLKGRSVGSWNILRLINFGKSAAVFLAQGADRLAAVKIFDDDLIKRYGDSTQLARIDRECQLIGKNHPNLVPILGGGIDDITENHFIVMAYLEGPNLKQCLQDVRVESIGPFVSQLASAARFLEEIGFCHRDIKPENIIITDDFERLVLLDLGVLKPISGSSLTDVDGVHPFIGTLQYSSPEFLIRNEVDNLEGMRALTYYQIGAVLHDLIMRKPLFAEFAEPYARLVNAVQNETPQIQNSAVPFRLVDLARSCLLKDWNTRLKLVQWGSFDEPLAGERATGSAKQRVTNRTALAQAQLREDASIAKEPTAFVHARFAREIIDVLCVSARALRSENPILPPIRIVMDAPERHRFAILFSAASEFGLKNDLAITVRLDIVDLDGRVVAVAVLGCLGDFNIKAELPCADRTVFRGVYDTAATEAALENCIYDLLDQAQRQEDAMSERIMCLLPQEESC